MDLANMAVTILMLGLTGLVLSTASLTDMNIEHTVSRETSQQIALNFTLRCPTFKFDGITETVQLTRIDVMPGSYCWKFTFEFDCRQAGYGNRMGQMLAQVTTHHRLETSVMQGMITSARIDGMWDELNQKLL